MQISFLLNVSKKKKIYMCRQDITRSSIDSLDWFYCLICCPHAWCRDSIFKLSSNFPPYTAIFSKLWLTGPAFKEWLKMVIGNVWKAFCKECKCGTVLQHVILPAEDIAIPLSPIQTQLHLLECLWKKVLLGVVILHQAFYLYLSNILMTFKLGWDSIKKTYLIN